MNVIVVVGSRHGSTRSIAQAVGAELRAVGHEVTVVDAEDAAGVTMDTYDAAVVGSAVYVGQWTKDARAFVRAHRASLLAMPLWLFSSGPVGDAPAPPDEVSDVGSFASSLRAIGYRVFSGNLDHDLLSLPEQAAVRVMHVGYGDVRDWDQIRAWATTIAAFLTDLARRHAAPPTTA